jgi:hypothetical protein
LERKFSKREDTVSNHYQKRRKKEKKKLGNLISGYNHDLKVAKISYLNRVSLGN